jgi:hypothetical protein
MVQFHTYERILQALKTTLPFICLVIYIALVHDKFCLMLYDR